jgi:hypothetical protein
VAWEVWEEAWEEWVEAWEEWVEELQVVLAKEEWAVWEAWEECHSSNSKPVEPVVLVEAWMISSVVVDLEACQASVVCLVSAIWVAAWEVWAEWEVPVMQDRLVEQARTRDKLSDEVSAHLFECICILRVNKVNCINRTEVYIYEN